MELKMNDSAVLAQNAYEIKKLGKRMVEDVIKIGKLLSDSKKICGYGKWEEWLKNEFGWTQMTATRYMNVFEMSKTNKLLDLDVPISALYQLAAPSTPSVAVEEIVIRAQAGEKINTKDVKKTIERAKVDAKPAITPLKMEDKKVGELKPVVDLKPEPVRQFTSVESNQSKEIDVWETDPRTIKLKADYEGQLKQANRRNDSLKDEIDELKEQLAELRQIKELAQAEGYWDEMREAAVKYRRKRP